MKLKICGIRSTKNCTALGKLHPDFIGFIFHKQSPRNLITPIINTPKGINRVGVFVNKPIDFIKQKKEQYQLNYIQLHGKETPDFCKQIKLLNVGVIKAFNITDAFCFDALSIYEPVCDYFLFDASGILPGGNGTQFNWELLQKYNGTTPFLLSGGINETMVDKLKSISHKKFAGIDINSGFELAPGIKNIQKIKTFKYELHS